MQFFPVSAWKTWCADNNKAKKGIPVWALVTWICSCEIINLYLTFKTETVVQLKIKELLKFKKIRITCMSTNQWWISFGYLCLIKSALCSRETKHILFFSEIKQHIYMYYVLILKCIFSFDSADLKTKESFVCADELMLNRFWITWGKISAQQHRGCAVVRSQSLNELLHSPCAQHNTRAKQQQSWQQQQNDNRLK